MNASRTLMAAETEEAADAVRRALDANAVAWSLAADRVRASDPAVAVTIARGSSDHCALYLKYLIEIELGVPCASIGPSIASLYRAPLRLERAVAIAISQSGQSPDIVEMQRAARRAGALTLAFVNDEASLLAREADCLLPLMAGPERSVAATKSVIAAMAGCAALVAAWRRDGGMADAVRALPAALRTASATPPAKMVETVAAARSLFVLGRGATYATAAEAALKLKETCGVHAEAFSSAEVLHGPAEIISPGFPVIAFMPQDEARTEMSVTLARIHEMGAHVMILDSSGEDASDRLAAAPTGHPLLAPIAMIHRFYSLAEATARRLGRDPDRPMHLSKVTETR